MNEKREIAGTIELGSVQMEAGNSETYHVEAAKDSGAEEGIRYINIKWVSEEALPDLELILWTPLKEFHALWNPSLGFNKGFSADWIKGFRSQAVSWAPVISLYRYDGRNALTLALDDARRTLYLDSGVNEETARFKCVIRIPSDGSGRKTLALKIRLDERALPYHKCLKETASWWEGLYPPLITPDKAKRPLLSTWYSFHLDLNEKIILEECIRGKELGFGGIIIDDGWQTEDIGRTYAYCGEWKPAASKIPDMRKLVDKIHNMDMTCMLWYALPYIGERTQEFKKWKNRTLEIDPPYPEWHVLDPRFPEVREHIIRTYEKALEEWDLDGFKLDFIDRFSRASAEKNPPGPGMDIPAVPDAVDTLLTDLAARLKARKPEIILECRQAYIGPLSRKYGNVFRSNDCPNSSLTNRVSLLDIRLLCGRTATHADPLMWNREESAESASMQFTHTLFSVPQVSVLLAPLSDEHREMVRHWLSFYNSHRKTLIDGSIEPSCPSGLYDQVTFREGNEQIIVCYNRIVAEPDKDRSVYLINAAWEKEVIIKSPEKAAPREYAVIDCCGREVASGKIRNTIETLPVPPASIVELR